jgi:hypothetical protein
VRKRVALLFTAVTMALTMSLSGVAFAAPDFGPGNSQKGPNDPGAKCHPPGQTTDRAECK